MKIKTNDIFAQVFHADDIFYLGYICSTDEKLIYYKYIGKYNDTDNKQGYSLLEKTFSVCFEEFAIYLEDGSFLFLGNLDG